MIFLIIGSIIQRLNQLVGTGDTPLLREGINIVDASTPVVRCELELLCDVIRHRTTASSQLTTERARQVFA